MEYYTNSFGHPISNDSNSLTVGPNGPMLMQDVDFHNKLAHFDRERIPERVVHAKGAGAFGYFECSRCMSKYTMASFLQSSGQRTKVFTRFSTVIGSKGSADTARDPRGFAVKFYTKEGTYDIAGNNIPVFFIRDGIRFPDLVHSLKPAPDTNIRDPERFWDFASLMPESTHMITWVYSDRGTIKDYRRMDGFGVNTFIWVNRQGERLLIKYHFKTRQGIETITRTEAERLAACDPDIATRMLYDAIQCGNYPKWDVCVQMMAFSKAKDLDFDPLDDTKVWPETDFPLTSIGTLTLNENPKNFFAQVEQAAFCPANLIPGVELSDDKMLQARSFAYLDTQRHRLGPNFSQLPINYPATKVCNNERDGEGTYRFNPEPINYLPNSLNHNQPAPYTLPCPPSACVCGPLVRTPIEKTSDFKQAGEHYRSLSDLERAHLIDNIAVELCTCNNEIVTRLLSYFSKADEEFGTLVQAAVIEYRKRSKK